MVSVRIVKPVRTPATATAADAQFEALAGEVLRRLQAGLRSLLDAVPGITRRPTDIQETLRIPFKLAWQVHRFARADDPFAEAAHLPGRVGTNRFLDAARCRLAPEESVRELVAALAAYEALVGQHAGSRTEFESLLSGLADNGSEHVDLVHKRSAFRGQRHLLGVQAQTHLACHILCPSEKNEDLLDYAVVRGLIHLQRLRHDVGWILSSLRAMDDDGTLREHGGPEALDPASDPEGVGYLPDFCSTPLPKLRRLVGSDGTFDVEIQPNGLGAKAAITCLAAHVLRGALGRYVDPRNRLQVVTTRVRTPCTVLVHDTLMHRDLLPTTPPTVSVYSDHREAAVTLFRRDRDLLVLRETVVYMGRGTDVLQSPDVPRYTELGQYVFERLGRKAEDFAVYRCRVEYPVMPSSVVVRFDPLEKPTSPMA